MARVEALLFEKGIPMSYRYSVYVLSPDRRFVKGLDDLSKAQDAARENCQRKKDTRGFKIESAEVWDNEIQAPVFSAARKHGGKIEEHVRDDAVVREFQNAYKEMS